MNQKIKKNRLRLHLTQRQLGDICGVTPQAVSLWEKGETFPDDNSIKILDKIFFLSLKNSEKKG